MTDFKEKFNKARTEATQKLNRKITNSDIAEFLGVTPEAISQWNTGKRGVSYENKVKLAQFFEKEWDYFLENSEKKDLHQINQKYTKSTNDTVYVPFFKDGIVSAGKGVETDDLGEAELLPFKPSDLRIMFNVSPNAKIGIVPCFGNSMEPTIKESDLIVFCQDDTKIEGAIYVCKYDGELFVKRLKKRPKLALVSDNAEYEPIEIKEDMEVFIIGRVVGSYSINSKRF